MSVALPPAQIPVGPVIVVLTLLPTVTVLVAVAEQLPLVTFTEYAVVAVGETLIAAVVAPVFQE